MPVHYNNDVKNARMAEVITAIDAAPAAAKLQIGTAGMSSVLVTMNLNIPSFVLNPATVANSGVATINMTNTPTIEEDATAAGAAAAARILDGADNVVITGLTVGTTTAAEVQLNSTDISNGQRVTITSGAITHAV